MLEFEGCDDGKEAVIKAECLDAENVDENITNCSKNEEMLRIKCEEIDIKEELDLEAEIGNDNFASSNKNIRKSDLEGKKHFCPKCLYSSNRKYDIKRHMRLHSDNKQYKCLLCTYITDNKISLRVHLSSHKGRTKEFGCHKCHYQTDVRKRLARHFLKHKDVLEMEAYKCALCPFISMYKSALVAHHRLQHGENIKMYKCEECSFTTKYRSNLAGHQMMHADPKVVNKFECERCPYWSKRQCDLNRHMITHFEELAGAELNTFDHSGQYNGVGNNASSNKDITKSDSNDLGKEPAGHSVKHADKLKVEFYNCPLCPFISKYKSALVTHQRLQHNKNPTMYKCKECSFTTKYKESLMRHQLMHADPKVVNKFKCGKCPYRGKRRSHVNRHMISHSKELPKSDMQT